MTQEEKAKAYDRVSKEVKDFFEGRQKMYSDVSQTLEYLFPELKESEDEKVRKALISILKSDFEKDTTINDISVGDIITWLEKQGKQKPQRMISAEAKEAMYDKPACVCSEEDERMFKSLNKLLNEASCYSCTEGVDKILSWLKSLRPQPKQEWSEADEAVLDALIRRLEGEDIYVSPHLAAGCLKSLRHQNRWKPSDKQLEALSAMTEYCDLATSFDVYMQEVVESLYQDLKKLKEE